MNLLVIVALVTDLVKLFYKHNKNKLKNFNFIFKNAFL